MHYMGLVVPQTIQEPGCSYHTVSVRRQDEAVAAGCAVAAAWYVPSIILNTKYIVLYCKPTVDATAHVYCSATYTSTYTMYF